MKKSGELRMRAPLGWARACYGLDLGDGAPVLVRAARAAHGGISCAPADPASETVRAEIRKTGVVVAACMPDKESFTRRLTTPFQSPAKARLVFPSMLDVELPFPLDECVYSFLPSRPSDTLNQRALAVGARFADAERRIDSCRAAGFDPVVLDHEGIALWTRSIEEMPAAPGAVRVAAHVTANTVILAIGRNGEFTGSYTVRKTPENVERVLKAVLADGGDSMEWAWAGPGAADKKNIADIDGLVAGKWRFQRLIHDDPAHFLARALAVRALSAGMLRCNLATGRLEHPTLAARMRKKQSVSHACLLASGIALLAVSILLDFRSGRGLDAIRGQFARRVDALVGRPVAARGDHALAEVEKALKKQAQDRAPFMRALSPSQANTVGTILDAAGEGDMAYDALTLREGSVTLSGSCVGWSHCEKLVGRLKEAGFQVKVDRRESSSDGRMRFTISPGGGNG